VKVDAADGTVVFFETVNDSADAVVPAENNMERD